MRKDDAYLLRLWNAGDRNDTWRASLENVRSREVLYFASREQFAQFLHLSLANAKSEMGDSDTATPL